MSEQYLGAIDQGTTSTRFILFNTKGQPVALHQVDLKNYFPSPGWQEQDPEDIIRSVFECIDGVLKQGYSPKQIISIGVTNQRETVVVWDRNTGKPYCNTIVWCDTRTEHIVTSLIAEYGGNPDYFREKTGLPISTYFSLFKVIWLMKNNSEVCDAITNQSAMIGTVDSWILYCLTGHHHTDVTNASRTMMMNLNTLQWDNDICSAFSIPIQCLPRIHHNTYDFGRITVGPLEGIHVHGALGDQQAALLGLGCLSPGEVKNTYGTGCFLLMNTGDRPVQSSHGLLTTVAFQLGEQNTMLTEYNKTAPLQAPSSQSCYYALEGSVASCGSLLNWLCDSFRVASNPSELVDYAGLVPNNANVYIVPAFSGLLCPHWCPSARGIIIGLTRYSNYQHLCRAAIESIALQTLDVVDAMREDLKMHHQGVSSSPSTSLRDCPVITTMKVDGGVSRSELLCAFQSDVLNIPVLKAVMQERTALGAALAAGLGAGVWSSISAMQQEVFGVKDNSTLTSRSSPSPSPSPSPSMKTPSATSQQQQQQEFPITPVNMPSTIQNEVFASNGFIIYNPQPDMDGFRKTTREQWNMAVERSKGWAKL